MADKTLEENMESILDIEVSDTPEGGCTTRKDQLRDVTEDREKDYEYTLADLHKKMKDLDEEKKGPTKVTNNAMFVGSTSELQKMLKQMNGGKR